MYGVRSSKRPAAGYSIASLCVYAVGQVIHHVLSVKRGSQGDSRRKSYALKCHNLGLQASMLQLEGDLYRKMGILPKSYECVTEAVALLSGARTQEDYLLLSDSMGYLMFYYITDGQLQKAWEVGQRRKKCSPHGRNA